MSEAATVQVTASASPRSCTIGDPVTLTIAVIHDRGLVVGAPRYGAAEAPEVVEAGKRVGALDVLEAALPKTTEAPGGRLETRFVYQLSTLDVGAHEIPGLTVSVTSEGRTESIAVPTQKIEVTSVLPAAEEGPGPATVPSGVPGVLGIPNLDIKDLKAPASVAPDYTLWALFVGAAALGCLLLLLARRLWRRRSRPLPVKPSLPPYEEAVAALDALKARRLPAQGQWKEMAAELSEIVRRYVHRRYDVLALEATTRELLRELGESKAFEISVEDPRLGHLRDLLEETDLVKFARYVPPLSAENDLMALAYGFLAETREVVASSPPAPGAPARQLEAVS